MAKIGTFVKTPKFGVHFLDPFWDGTRQVSFAGTRKTCQNLFPEWRGPGAHPNVAKMGHFCTLFWSPPDDPGSRGAIDRGTFWKTGFSGVPKWVKSASQSDPFLGTLALSTHPKWHPQDMAISRGPRVRIWGRQDQIPGSRGMRRWIGAMISILQLLYSL